MKIKLMTDYYCWPLWWAGEHEPGNINPETLSLSNELVVDLEKWAADYDAQLNLEDPASSNFLSGVELELFAQKGLVLWQRLIDELAPEYEIWYYHPMTHSLIKSPKMKVNRET